MKRSRIIQIISDIIYDESYPELYPDECNSTAITILDELENLGMKPPAATFPGLYVTMDEQNNVYPPTPQLLNKWEPE